MNEKKEDQSGATSKDDAWVKSMGEFWGSLAGQWVSQAQQQPWTLGGKSANPKAQATMDAALKNWQAMTGAMANPESISSLLKGSGAMPEMLLNLAQSSLGGFGKMQQNIIDSLGRVGASAEAYKFQDIDENIFRISTDIYEKEFKQFFHVPQLGLMRTYQEKNNQLADKYNFFQSTLAEFLNLLGLPFNRAMQVMQDKIGEMAENGTLPEDSKVYYNMWVKVLEGHYMTLYQTPEYVETMAKTINALADFSAARDAVLEDMLSLIPVARKSDMDDMARELYEVKKRLRKLEKEQKK
jgi:polyhydroxyalkanoate synthesis regulator phasin